MKIEYLDLCGFRGYRNRVRIEFGDRFTVIDGRNGVGKSTIFDAIEFAMTGQLSKYMEAKAAGESVADYIWWKGSTVSPKERFVEVGFRGEGGPIAIRREQIAEPDSDVLRELERALCDSRSGPASPMKQLCAASIIRDEHITSLSLDLKEADRYALLRDALGANDAVDWTTRAADIVSIAKKRSANAQQEVSSANAELAAASRRLDEVRASLTSEAAVADATKHLQAFLGTSLPADLIAGAARERIALARAEIQDIQQFGVELNKVRTQQQRLPSLIEALASKRRERDLLRDEVAKLGPATPAADVGAAGEIARNLATLVELGRKLGLRDGHCPLCEQYQSATDYDHALHRVAQLAEQISADAVRSAEEEKAAEVMRVRLELADLEVIHADVDLGAAQEIIDAITIKAVTLRLTLGLSPDDIASHVRQIQAPLEAAENAVRVLDTLRLNEALERAVKSEGDAKTRSARAQDRFGKARKAESNAHALHDASRRAASETLDRRLERVLPLMSELYRRLRPHPLWNDIEYSIRGDVRRFLKLQVGGDLNPQFLFSSGQRRATGLAFLLSVNLSLAWSRWRTILLDDPVQHVDDFRSVHLAELLAQVVHSGRQVICAVEDAALADMLARRMPIFASGAAKRLTLGPDETGALTIKDERLLTPFTQRVFGEHALNVHQAA